VKRDEADELYDEIIESSNDNRIKARREADDKIEEVIKIAEEDNKK
jgi:hypothetical protein